MGDPTLFYCVGAAKSGTSWLYETLARHPQAHLRSIKELHYFDAIERGRIERHLSEIRADRARLIRRMESAAPARLPDLALRIADRTEWLSVLERGEDDDAYLRYLTRGRGQARLVGEITPAYALLPIPRLRKMATILPDTRFLYLLRDPVARLWSHIRMIARRRGGDGQLDPRRARNIFERTLRGEESEITRRGDYAGALRRLRAAIAPDRVLTLFSENLFAGTDAQRLWTFLGLSPIRIDPGHRVHSGADLPMPEALRRRARDWLAEQYEHVAREVGPLPQAWQDNKVRV